MFKNKENVLIEVYKEHTAFCRHEDNILYKFGAVLLPVSFVALGIPYFKDIEEPTLTIFEIISTSGGIILMTFWVSYVYASHAKIKARFQIINEIECQIETDCGIKGHKDVPCMRDNIFRPPRPFQLKTHFLEQLIFYVYTSMALLLTAGRICYKWCVCKDPVLATASFVPLGIVFSCCVIAVLYKGSIKRGEKRLKVMQFTAGAKIVR